MPRGLHNWNFKDVVSFLEQHFFKSVQTNGSHHFYRGYIDGKEKLTFIQRHGSKTIPPKSFEGTIHKSGIPKRIWKEWSSNKSVRYPGAKPF